MGGQSSNMRNPERQGPRSFYLILGEPSIRYTRSRTKGPLIYDVCLDAYKSDSSVEHAETLELSAAVPAKQDFALVPCDALDHSSGYTLKFEISRRDRPPNGVEVYAGVAVEYVPLEGVRISQAEKSQNPFCVMRTLDFDPDTAQMTTTAPILLSQLTPAAFSEEADAANTGIVNIGSPRASGAPGASRKLISAPVMIAIKMDCTVENDHGSHLKKNNNNNNNQHMDNELASITSSSDGQLQHQQQTPGVQDVRLYTFLDFPPEAYERVPAVPDPASPRPRSAQGRLNGAPPNTQTAEGLYKGHVVKQLLQIGSEVYELDDVFDLGAAAQVDNEGEEEDDDAALCVICLTHPKDTTILPCRHMCLCYDCAGQLRLATNKCPICRGDIERVMTL